ncbi:MAG TPA: hypothetical protein VFC57_06735 [Aeromicrobium sp.]|nr:hypothetical protein [Aeromicrobium sp.]
MKVTANATRTKGWWAVEVPEVEGAFTQTRRLDQVARMAAEVVSMLKDVDAESVDVDVVALPPRDDRELIDRVVAQGSEANAGMASYAAESRRVVALLLERGYTVRDIGRLLGISATRVSQLSPKERATNRA